MQKIAVEGAVDQVMFVGFDIVDLAQDLRVAVAAGQAGNRPEAGAP